MEANKLFNLVAQSKLKSYPHHNISFSPQVFFATEPVDTGLNFFNSYLRSFSWPEIKKIYIYILALDREEWNLEEAWG